jgi:16S rRNA (cytosine1402-N4)-methyltransferase
MNPSPHQPVSLQEVIAAVQPKAGDVLVDGTFGAGGYSEALLKAADCHVIGIDRDPSVREHVTRVQQEFGERFTFMEGCFGDVHALLAGRQVDGLVLDIGVSSMQLDTPERGFSFRFDAPLDMRMSGEGESAADVLATRDEKEIADILWRYGEEKASRRIAASIVAARAENPVTTTAQLRELVHRIIPVHRGKGIDPATRTFQALRIAVNRELEELQEVLNASISLLKAGGRLVVVTFHSLEDRLVKQFMREHATLPANPSRHLPPLPDATNTTPVFSLLTSKAVRASEADIAANPRARSATLRACVRMQDSEIRTQKSENEKLTSESFKGGHHA